MSTPPRLALPVLLLVAGALPAGRLAFADTVVTKDGLVLEGAVTKAADGAVTVVSEAGTVRIAASAVKSVTPGEGPRAALRREAKALAASDAAGWYRLSLRAEEAGAPDLAREALRAVVAAEPDHAAARRALGYEKVDGAWVPLEEARRRSGLVLFGGEWVLPKQAEAAAAAAPAGPAPAKDAVLSVMRAAAAPEPALSLAAEARLTAVPAAEREDAATALLLDRDPRVRTWACAHLAALGDERALRPLILSAVRDRDPEVRRSAALACTSFGNDDVAVPFVRAMSSTIPWVSANAMRALAVIGDKRVIGFVVKHIIAHGESPRSVIQSLNKVSYVRDYDVEIAQNANIANPIIGQAVEGVVFDVKVHDASTEKTVIETVAMDTFNALAGTSFHEVAEVAAWWEKHGAEYPGFPEKPTSTRAPARRPAY
jgi:hypothetical protein